MEDIVAKLRLTYNEHPRALAAALGLTAATAWAYRSYSAFIRHIGSETKLFMPTPFIWVMAVASGLMAKETTGTALYNADENKETWLSKDIPQRKGPRPSGGDFIVPHRQHSQIPSEAFRKRIEATMQQHIDANSAFLKMAPSPHERVIPSVCLRDDIPSPYKMTDLSLREVYHVHEQDASIHLTLSPQDCVTAIKRGWAERHPLSGTAVLPAQYLFVYAPRDEQELKVVEQLVRASSGYLLNRRDIA